MREGQSEVQVEWWILPSVNGRGVNGGSGSGSGSGGRWKLVLAFACPAFSAFPEFPIRLTAFVIAAHGAEYAD